MPGIVYTLESLVHLSLNTYCQERMLELDFLYRLCELAEKLRNKSVDEIDHLCLRNCVRVLSNLCICEKNQIITKHERFWNLFVSLQSYDRAENDEINLSIKEESKLALVTFPDAEIAGPDAKVEGDKRKLIKFIGRSLSSKNILIQYKALGAITAISQNMEKRKLIFEHKIHLLMIKLVGVQELYMVRELARAVFKLLYSPDQMVFWMKFDSPRLALDATINRYVLKRGNPSLLPRKYPKMYGWGVQLGIGDCFEIADGGLDLEYYSVSFWFLPEKRKEKGWYTLLQGPDGVGGLLAIDENFERLGTFDENTGTFHPTRIIVSDWIPLPAKDSKKDAAKKKEEEKKTKGGKAKTNTPLPFPMPKPDFIEDNMTKEEAKAEKEKSPRDPTYIDWKHICILVSRQPGWQMMSTVFFYVDGELKDKISDIYSMSTIKYVGNSADGKEPFGIIADFRIYPYHLSPDNLYEIVNARVADLPDKYHDYLNEEGFMNKIMRRSQEDMSDMQIEICKLIKSLATKRSCRLYLIENDAHEQLIKLVNHHDPKLALEAQLALTALL